MPEWERPWLRWVPPIVIPLWAVLPGLAHGAVGVECRGGDFTEQAGSYRLASVVHAPRAYLREGPSLCDVSGPVCGGPPYVVPGDVVVTGLMAGQYVCALFHSKTTESAGFLLRSELSFKPVVAAMPHSAWIGTWRNGDDEITLRAAGAALAVTGYAFWPSAAPSEYQPSPHVGEVSGTARPVSNTVIFAGKSVDDCRVSLTLLPPYLLARDNRQCGGMNVSFTGVYRKG